MKASRISNLIPEGFLGKNNFSGTPANKGLAALLTESPGKSKKAAVAAPSILPVIPPANTVSNDLPLSDIIPDPKQPRHYYSPAEEEDLRNSVKAKGILQHILVRPHEGKYMIVFGERRYRAAVSVCAELPERNTIPATIRSLTDDEALELQIIENLQRKDVQPMEEATAFKSLSSRLTIEEIALRVGKSQQYVAQRMTLTSLIKDFQEMLFQHKMKLAQAYKLSRLSEQSQLAIFKDATQYHNNWRTDSRYELSNIDHYVSRELLDLSKAPFKTTDPTLNPEMGACTTCPFNTANSPLLFPELNKKRFCNNAVCHQVKSNRSFQKSIESVLQKPDVLLVNCSSYLDASEKQKLKSVEEMGATVLNRDLFEMVNRPEPLLSWEAYLKENDHWSNDEDYSAEEKATAQKECEEEYAEEANQYREDLAKYEEYKSTGRIKKAFVVLGKFPGEQGKLVDIVIRPRKGAVLPAAADSSSINTTVEIAAIQERENRNVELDREKVFKDAMTSLKEGFISNTDPLRPEEVKALLILLIDTSYNTRDFAAKELELGNDYNRIAAYNKLLAQDITSPMATRLIRLALFDKLYSPTELDYKKNGKAAAMFDLATLWMPDQVKDFEARQKEKATKRNANVNKRLDALKHYTPAKDASGESPGAGGAEVLEFAGIAEEFSIE
jgi:ParB family chromosome partitioning protein